MADTRPAPYPTDTRAKGWRFELDHERIAQSSTWALAGAEGRPWLLMLWMTAWQQVPCGSLPDDEEVIAALIGCPAKAWPKLRKALMRGWQQAEDGRLYHATITERVLEMVEQRSKTAKRVAEYKAKMREQQGGNALPTRESHDKNDTGTGTSTGTNKRKEKEKSAPLCVAPSVLVEAGFSPEAAAEFIAHKSRHKAPLTERAWADHLSESLKAGWTPLQAAEKVMAKEWKGFEAKYVADEKPAVIPLSFRERESAAAAARVHEMTGGLVSANKPRHDALQEVFDATPRLVG